jgi:hypothetical protein
MGKNVRQLSELVNHWWNEQIYNQSNDRYDQDKRQDDGQCPYFDVQLVLNEFDNGI